MKLLVDMNLSPQWSEALTRAGHLAMHCSEVGDPTASDRTILEFARSGGWTLLTLDLDFGDILAATDGDEPSVVQIRAGRTSPTLIARTVLAAINEHADAIRDGALVTVDLQRARVRLLPVTRRLDKSPGC